MLTAAALLLAAVGVADTTQTAALVVQPVPAPDLRPRVHIGDVLDDDDLRDAVVSGLPIRVAVRVELWRDGWIDALESTRSWTAVLLYEPLSRGYIVRDQAAADSAGRYESYDLARAAIERSYEPALRPARTGRYYYTATLEIETLSLSDLDELERWLQGELGPAVGGDRSIAGAVVEGAKRLLIKLLGLPSRRVEARSDRFDSGTGEP